MNEFVFLPSLHFTSIRLGDKSEEKERNDETSSKAEKKKSDRAVVQLQYPVAYNDMIVINEV